MLLLVTDHGFLNELDHVWETLEDVDGGGSFLDSRFRQSSTSQTQQRREATSKVSSRELVDDVHTPTNTAEENTGMPDLEYVKYCHVIPSEASS